MSANRTANLFGAEYLADVPPAEYGCACGDLAIDRPRLPDGPGVDLPDGIWYPNNMILQ